jgi:glycosyltransferase involved in cell wall biosynthesis
MRVALIGPVYPYRGGIAHYTTMLCRALRERGNHVLLVSFKRLYPQWLFPGRSDKDPSKQPLEVEDVQYWIDSLNPFTWLATFWRIRQYRPDVLILQWWTTFWAPVWFVLGALNRLILRKPLVYICHNVLPHETRWWDSWVARVVLQWGSRFIVQSKEEEVRLATLMPRVQVAIAPHPVYDMFADQRIPKEEARKCLGLPPNVPILLSFGIVREYKGLLDILAALPEIQAQLGKVMLVVAGEFWADKRPYVEMIEQMEIGDQVIIEDRYIPNEEVGLYFSAADVLVAPYRRRTASGVVQMARGFGMPVFNATIGEKRERIASETETTILSDKLAVAKAINSLVKAQTSESFGTKAQMDVPFTWEALARLLESVSQPSSAVDA